MNEPTKIVMNISHKLVELRKSINSNKSFDELKNTYDMLCKLTNDIDHMAIFTYELAKLREKHEKTS